ncbi:MAG: hypothetical protein ACYC3A_09795 [Halothiobacillus sp.]
MNADWLIHPPGGLPEAAPKGLVDVWMNTPPPAAEQFQHAMIAALHTHGEWIAVGTVLLILLGWGGFYLWRNWRGIILRGQINRLRRVMTREPQTLPEPVGAALMWALARYFKMRPAVDRRRLPLAWQAHIATLDALRFGSAQADVADWQALLAAMWVQTRIADSASNAAPKAVSA